MERRTDLQSRVDSMLADANRLLASAPDIQNRLRELTVTRTSARGDVEATAGPGGTLVGLRIDPRAFRSPDAADLAVQVLQASMAAASAINGQAKDILDEYLPPGLSAKALLGLGTEEAVDTAGTPAERRWEGRDG